MNCDNTEIKSSFKSLLPSIDNYDNKPKYDSEIKLIKNIKNYIESPDFPINIKDNDFKDSLTEKIDTTLTNIIVTYKYSFSDNFLTSIIH